MKVLLEGVVKNETFRGVCDNCSSLIEADREDAKKNENGIAVGTIETSPDGEIMHAACPVCGRAMLLYGSSTAKCPEMPTEEVMAKAKEAKTAAKAAVKAHDKAEHAAHASHAHAHKK